MIVVADTSPINYLILIEEISILGDMYGHVIVPQSVHSELLRPGAPAVVRKWMEELLPPWLEVRTPPAAPDPTSDASLNALNLGEREAIMLATELNANRLLVDDLQGRIEAEKRGIRVTGTVGVLREASRFGLLDLASAVRRLQQTNFHISPQLLQRILSE
jgi:predicted nucleic acid-binding protein